MDLGSGQAPGVAITIPSLMVLGCRPLPPVEPAIGAHEVAGGRRRVIRDHLPLVGVRAAGLVEKFFRHVELANVMQQRSPPKPAHLIGSQAHFLPNELAVRPHPFRVPPRLAVVRADLVYESKRHLARQLRVVELLSAFSKLRQLLLGPAGTSVSQGEPEPGRGFIREDEAELEERDQRQEAPGNPVSAEQHDRRDEEGADPPEHNVNAKPFGRQVVGQLSSDEERRDDWNREDDDARDGRQHRARVPHRARARFVIVLGGAGGLHALWSASSSVD